MIVCIAVLLGSLAGFGDVLSFAQSVLLFDSIAAAHGLKSDTPHSSVQMTGTVDRGGKAQQFRLIATQDEQVRIEYGTAGTDTQVFGKHQSFHDDGKTFTYDKVTPGFSQLDITGLFFVEQLRARPVQAIAIGDSPVVAGVKMQRLRIENERTEMQKGTQLVKDDVDLFVNEAGLLMAVSRSFYTGRPDAYTQAFAFSDYRKTDDGLLPFQIDVYIKAQRRLTFKIERYQFDVPAEKGLFLGRRTK